MKKYAECPSVSFKYATGSVEIFERMFHDCYEIYFLLGGKVEFINDRTRQTLVPHQVVIVPPGEYHQFVVLQDDDAYERCVLNIDPAFFEDGILDSALKDKTVLTLAQNHRVIQNFLHLAASISDVDDSDFARILPAVTTDIVFAIKNDVDTHEISPEKLCRFSGELMEYINKNFTSALDLESLSKRFHRSVSSLCHVFKESFGVSIKKYVLEKRLNNARSLLRRGENAEYACTACGFSDYSSFYRAYKKRFGAAPSDSIKQ